MKRGSSGLSLVVAVNKPIGMSSHDVVNRCRRIFGERRVGHTGTLDPLASGVLPICVGPATRLDKYLTGHDKRYRVTMALGCETSTDDVMGEVIARGTVMPDLLDGSFADAYVAGYVGKHEQVPPRYSAIKIAGKKAYELARKGDEPELAPRSIEVYESRLVERVVVDDEVRWVIDFSVSKGTYIRALVRDMGRELGCRAYVSALERRVAGTLDLEDCVNLDTLEALGVNAAIDPVRVLGFRFAFADDYAKTIESGGKLSVRAMKLHEYGLYDRRENVCACTTSLSSSSQPPAPDELVSLIVENRLKAVYRFDAERNCFRPDCVFATPVVRHAVEFGGNVPSFSI